MKSTNSSGMEGVSWHGQSQKWRVVMPMARSRVYLGEFTNIEAAREVMNKAYELTDLIRVKRMEERKITYGL